MYECIIHTCIDIDWRAPPTDASDHQEAFIVFGGDLSRSRQPTRFPFLGGITTFIPQRCQGEVSEGRKHV